MKKIILLHLLIFIMTPTVFAYSYNPWPGQYRGNSWGDNSYQYHNRYSRYKNNRYRNNYDKMTPLEKIIRAKRVADRVRGY